MFHEDITIWCDLAVFFLRVIELTEAAWKSAADHDIVTVERA